ncbi:MAG: tyrosine-type recombinase/integrase [Alistipes sp.]|nr:tyrosine-type recombinase/integrase [Alistipes sp.]
MSNNATGWDNLIRSYTAYLRFERNLAENTVESYLRDISQFRDFLVKEYGQPDGTEMSVSVSVSERTAATDRSAAREPATGTNPGPAESPLYTGREHIEQYLASLYDRRVEVSTQARILSGIKSFFSYLVLNDNADSSPAEFVEMPKPLRKLPDVLSVEEIDTILDGIDLSHPQGHRNKAIIETLYSCGLRVSELISLRLGDLFFDDGFVRVTGKGNKQRLVPLSPAAKKNISFWLEQRRSMDIDPKHADIVFLNRRGRKLTREMVYIIVERAAETAGIRKKISPHTFRHSFATHLLRGGASIRQVQDLLGHGSIITTEIYTHLDNDSLRESLEKYHPLGDV